ncbi:MAG: YrdB family protein [Vicingaceae bacterium]|nr:YrdB family protein [Vicingaceae bacterium]
MNLGSHPLNLILRFLLEMTVLITVSYWGYYLTNTPVKYLNVISFPIFLATLWGVFAVPNDPSRSGKTVVKTPGVIRLIIELIFFSFGAIAFYLINFQTLAIVFLIIVLLHYLLSVDRVNWLLKQ